MNSNNDSERKKTFFTGVDIQRQKISSQRRPMSSIQQPSQDNMDFSEEKAPKYKKRNKLYEKILFPPPYEDYYQQINEVYNITPQIYPGLTFIKRIFSHEKAEKAVQSLRLNIPETYWNDTEMVYVYNDMDNYGALTMIKNKKDFDLFETVLNIENTQYNRQLEGIDPFIVIRTRESEYENAVKVERFEKSQDNLGKDIGDGIVQRYIRCRGRNRELDKITRLQQGKEERKQGNGGYDKQVGDERKKSLTKPTVIRLEYKTRYNRQKGSNVGYCLINKNFVEPSIQPATKDIIEKYTQLTTLNTAKENSFFIYIMSGESIAPYEFFAEQLVLYVQKWFKLLLKTIVVDFMKDERGIVYFLGVKAYLTVRDPNEMVLLKTPGNAQALKIDDENNIRKFYKTWTCRLCMLPYPKAKITKIVTFKLLYKLKENLKLRGFSHFEHINNNIYNESQSCRVCDLCYTLLLTEQELMEIQKTIALCNNIDVPDDELLTNASKEPEGLVRAPQKFKSLVQWRIMFYFVKFSVFDFLKFYFMDGTEVPSNATPLQKKNSKTNYQLYITLFNQKLSIPLFTEMKHFLSRDEVSINASKVFYFFSTDSSNIKQILRNEEVDFRIILNDNWNEPIASCKTTCFSCYEDNVKDKPMTSRITLNFFSNYVKHFKCQAFIGLKNDGVVQTENLNMFCYKLPNPIYITNLDYYSYHSMPNDWYELYIPPDTKIEDDTNYDIEKRIDEIIRDLEGEDKKRGVKRKREMKEEEDEDKVYDPYELLVQVQNKDDIIKKIESLPIVKDKEFVEMKMEEKKNRPSTAKLKEKFRFEREKKELKPYKTKMDFNVRRKRMEREREKEKEREEERKIKEMDRDKMEELIEKMDKQFSMMESKL